MRDANPDAARRGAGSSPDEVESGAVARVNLRQAVAVRQDEPMTAYAVLLRGINVGGHHKVPMAELRELLIDAGFGDVDTYIASGNIVLTSEDTAPEVEHRVGGLIRDHFGFDVAIMVRAAVDLIEALARNPFPDGDPSQTVIWFAKNPISDDERERAEEDVVAMGEERFRVTATEVYIDFAGPISDSNLADQLSRVITADLTSRNVRTVGKIAEMLDALGHGDAELGAEGPEGHDTPGAGSKT